MVAANLLDKELTGPQLFSKLRVKFTNATKKVIFSFLILMKITIFVFFF